MFADVELTLLNLESALAAARSALEELGAVKGSEFLYEEDGTDASQSFGRNDGLALYLDGISLPEEVYAALDFEQLVEELEASLGAKLRSTWMGPEETALYYSVPDAEAVFAQAEPVLRSIPVCQNARVVLRHGHPTSNPREIRLPRH
jgi:hypothetical protein